MPVTKKDKKPLASILGDSVAAGNDCAKPRPQHHRKTSNSMKGVKKAVSPVAGSRNSFSREFKLYSVDFANTELPQTLPLTLPPMQ